MGWVGRRLQKGDGVRTENDRDQKNNTVESQAHDDDDNINRGPGPILGGDHGLPTPSRSHGPPSPNMGRRFFLTRPCPSPRASTSGGKKKHYSNQARTHTHTHGWTELFIHGAVTMDEMLHNEGGARPRSWTHNIYRQLQTRELHEEECSRKESAPGLTRRSPYHRALNRGPMPAKFRGGEKPQKGR